MAPPPDATSALPRPRAARAIYATTLLVILLFSALGAWRSPPRLAGGLDGLLPAPDRRVSTPPMLLVQVASSDDPDPDATLTRAAVLLADALKERRIPLAPPAAAVAGWLDAHGLYLLPVSAHAALAKRLEPEEMAASVEAIRARLSSPIYGVLEVQARRDPLALRPMLVEALGGLGHVEDAEHAAPTGTGDLRAREARGLLIGLRPEVDIAEVMAIADPIATQEGLRVDTVGREAEAARQRQELERRLPRLAMLVVAAGVLALALAMRRRAPLLLAAVNASVPLAVFAGLGVIIDPLTAPLVVMAWAVGLAGATWRGGGGRTHPGWGGWIVLATALTPLALLPYAPWRQWSFAWTTAVAAVAVADQLRRRASSPPPEVAEAPDGSTPTARPGGRLAAVLVVIALFASAGQVLERLEPRASVELEFGDRSSRALRDHVSRYFFAEHRRITFEIAAASEAEALDRAALDIQTLARFASETSARVESPGSFILPADALVERRRSLRDLRIEDRVEDLRLLIDGQGLRPEAFNEFLNGAVDLTRIPDANSGLESALGPWMRRFIEPGDAGVVLRHHLELRRIEPGLLDAFESLGTPRGPLVAGLQERSRVPDELLTLMLTQLWLVAFIVWLASRSLVDASVSALGLAAAWALTLVLAHAVQIPVGAHAYPVLLVIGGLAGIASARGVDRRSLATRRPFAGLGTAAVQGAAGAALLASGEILWRDSGLLLLTGVLAGAAFGRLIAPQLRAMITRAPGTMPTTAADKDKDKDKGGET